jgi:hypothetical protein
MCSFRRQSDTSVAAATRGGNNDKYLAEISGSETDGRIGINISLAARVNDHLYLSLSLSLSFLSLSLSLSLAIKEKAVRARKKETALYV